MSNDNELGSTRYKDAEYQPKGDRAERGCHNCNVYPSACKRYESMRNKLNGGSYCGGWQPREPAKPEPVDYSQHLALQGVNFSEVGIAVNSNHTYTAANISGEWFVLFRCTDRIKFIDSWITPHSLQKPFPSELDAWNAILKAFPDAKIEPKRPGWGRVWKVEDHIHAEDRIHRVKMIDGMWGCSCPTGLSKNTAKEAQASIDSDMSFNSNARCIGFVEWASVEGGK